jgi:hypothetical protein
LEIEMKGWTQYELVLLTISLQNGEQ